MPRLDYSRTSEIPAALGKLSPEELGSVLEARLRGESAGLPGVPSMIDSLEVKVLYPT
ncbi:MAG TPA: hypothetical protein VEO19_17575 [Terriglobia bacterium]|nr:hypothetical protein [Terriglobia bacterium]